MAVSETLKISPTVIVEKYNNPAQVNPLDLNVAALAQQILAEQQHAEQMIYDSSNQKIKSLTCLAFLGLGIAVIGLGIAVIGSIPNGSSNSMAPPPLAVELLDTMVVTGLAMTALSILLAHKEIQGLKAKLDLIY